MSTSGTTTAAGGGRRTGTRWWIVGLAALGTGIAYIDRANLAVAAPFVQQDLNLGPAQTGLLLSAFFWTYAVFQLPAGWTVDKLGPRFIYGAAAIWWAVFTAATALGRGFSSLLAFRLLMGVGEAPMQACNGKAVSEWFPRRERAFASSIYDTGSEFGSAISIPLVTALIALAGWRFSFVAAGLLGVVWAAVWVWFYRSPRRHPRASEEEVRYIETGGARTVEGEQSVQQEAGRETRTIPWRDLLRYRTIWGMVFGYICRGFVIYFFITWFPSFLVDDRGFTLLELGIYGAIPGLVAILGDWGGGLFSDWLDRRGVPLPVARKVPLVGGMLFASVIGLAALVQSAALALVLLTVSYTSVAFATGALLSLPLDVAPGPGNVSSIVGIQNLGSQIGGILSPAMVGFMLAATGGSYVLPLLVTGVITILGALTYLFVVKVEPLPVPARRVS